MKEEMKKESTHNCPGLSCEWAWNENGCQPFWAHSRNGVDISGEFYRERDADQKALWCGPDGPEEVWSRDDVGEWSRDDG